MSKKSKNLGIALYYVIVEKRRWGSHPQSTMHKLGPYSSMEKAKDVMAEQEEAVGEPGWEYTYRITVEPNLFSK